MYDTRDEQIRQLCFLSGVAAANIASHTHTHKHKNANKKLHKMENSRNFTIRTTTVW